MVVSLGLRRRGAPPLGLTMQDFVSQSQLRILGIDQVFVGEDGFSFDTLILLPFFLKIGRSSVLDWAFSGPSHLAASYFFWFYYH